MATTMTVRPGVWNEMWGVWFYVRPDPLAGAEFVRVTIYRTWDDVWADVEGACAGVRVQTVAPETADLP